MRRLLFSVFALTQLLPAQLTVDQRVHDFNNMTAMFAKRYAPAEWKKTLTGFDIFNTQPWLVRIRAAKNDIEFHEIMAEFVAKLDDAHTAYRAPGGFVADLGIVVDLYGSAVLVEAIDRFEYPRIDFLFEIGDEVVSVDGIGVQELIAQFSKLQKFGNPLSTNRIAAGMIAFRDQSVLPRAAELADTARVLFRRQNGDLETYTLTWYKSGLPYTGSGPVRSTSSQSSNEKSSSTLMAANAAREEKTPPYLLPLQEMQTWTLPDSRLFGPEPVAEEEGVHQRRKYLLSMGSRLPAFPLPTDFVLRLGRRANEFHLSGTFQSDGTRIGYLRIPTFTPASSLIAAEELDAEVRFLNANTDVLIVDVMRNPGGTCYMLDAARRLIPRSFFFFGEELRVTWDRIRAVQAALELAELFEADDWILESYRAIYQELLKAYREGKPRTSVLPSCAAAGTGAAPTFDHQPSENAYRKPIILLIDEFSSSAADIFPAMMQDNGAALLVGTRTMGAGGSISSWSTGTYSESMASNTNSLALRKGFVVTEGYPTTRYIENVGVKADVQLDIMTKENLLNRGQTFLRELTRIAVQRAKGER